MTADSELHELAHRYGILDSYRDFSGTARVASVETKRALLRANGVEAVGEKAVKAALQEAEARHVERLHKPCLVIESDKTWQLDLVVGCNWVLRVEDDDQVQEGFFEAGLSRMNALPTGVHELTLVSGSRRNRVTLLSAPKSAPSVGDIVGNDRIWGVTTALYGIKSNRNLGLGDFVDLAAFAEGVGRNGAAFVGINPVHALGCADNRVISPYSPSHRGFLNPLHIAADRIPGLEDSQSALALVDRQQETCANVKSAAQIDYNAFRTGFSALLDALFPVFKKEAHKTARAEFASFTMSEQRLPEFALYETVSELHGPDWREWPTKFRTVNGSGATTVRSQAKERIEFHSWLQWIANTQLAEANACAKHSGSGIGLYLDLAVGSRRGGAETWCEADSVANGVSVGAPPDHLAPEGQNWNLAAFAPDKLVQTRFQAFRNVLKKTMRHAGVIRIDHILGLNRSFWIPDDGSPGAYIQQPFKELLALVAIEAHRADTVVIGEDLGLVPSGFREAINQRGLYSYSVLQYERDDANKFRRPNQLREHCLTCFGTHDTPTMSGFAKGRDIDWWQKMNWISPAQADVAYATRVGEVQDLGGFGESGLSQSIHSAMAKSPSAMVSVQFDDITEQDEAQNLPGTIDEHPNWRRRSPISVEDVATLPRLEETGQIMQAAGRNIAAVANCEEVK